MAVLSLGEYSIKGTACLCTRLCCNQHVLRIARLGAKPSRTFECVCGNSVDRMIPAACCGRGARDRRLSLRCCAPAAMPSPSSSGDTLRCVLSPSAGVRASAADVLRSLNAVSPPAQHRLRSAWHDDADGEYVRAAGVEIKDPDRK